MTPAHRSSVGGAIEFDLPPELEVHDPPEARGLARDDVRLMVAHRNDGSLVHARFRDLATFLSPTDLLVINTSGTLPASLPTAAADGTELELHLSTPMPSGAAGFDIDVDRGHGPQPWIVELRSVDGAARPPFRSLRPGDVLPLPGAGSAEVLAPYPPDCGPDAANPGPSRLWVVGLTIPGAVGPYLAHHGHPIRYAGGAEWPASAYQTVFATEPGSAEMPSAGRPFTPEIIVGLIAAGVDIAPVTLHTGVSSLEDHEPPYAEFFRVTEDSARRVSEARRSGGRVVAVGTTAVRALESAAGDDGRLRAAEGWTDLVIGPNRTMRVVDGLLTGWHEPRASHLLMLEAIAGRPLLEASYRAAIEHGYRWHEFGDLHLILP